MYSTTLTGSVAPCKHAPVAAQGSANTLWTQLVQLVGPLAFMPTPLTLCCEDWTAVQIDRAPENDR